MYMQGYERVAISEIRINPSDLPAASKQAEGGNGD
jgi:hypothetical protein